MEVFLPNALTAARLLAVPAVVWLLLDDNGANGPDRWWALALFLVASATDFLDGYLARRWSVVSTFGKLADPIADKALILGTLTTLCVVDGLPWWPVAVLAFREVMVTLGRLAVASHTVIAASQGGKIKTALQSASVTFFLWPPSPSWLDATAWWILLLAVAVAVVSGLRYGGAIAATRRRPRPRDDELR